MNFKEQEDFSEIEIIEKYENLVESDNYLLACYCFVECNTGSRRGYSAGWDGPCTYGYRCDGNSVSSVCGGFYQGCEYCT